MPTSPRDTTSIASQRQEPIVLTLTEPLTRAVVTRLRSVVRGVSRGRPIIVDVTATPAFDSDGTAELLALQEEMGPRRLVIVGMRQAAARILDVPDLVADRPSAGPIPGLILIDVRPQRPVATLRSALRAAVSRHITIVIVDMAEVSEISRELVEVIETASHDAAHQGLELVVANVSPVVAAVLAAADLAPSTYVAVHE
jgi:anti-anti-sigma regulatory factor